MIRPAQFRLLLCLFTVLTFCRIAMAGAQTSALQRHPTTTGRVEWSSTDAQYMTGLAGVKAQEKGALTITSTEVQFTGKSGAATIPVREIIAVSAGNQRVELWGVKGRLLRMAIPEGGGLVAATMMHHRLDMLTVEFDDSAGGYHAAVFFLNADEAQQAMQSLATTTHHKPASNRCDAERVRKRTVRVLAPDWNDIAVPAAYRALLYEKLVERLGTVKSLDYVYRDGEADAAHNCAEFTVELSTTGFKAGSQVRRASMGPVGMFVGTTQMVFDLHITNAEGTVDYRNETKATVRGGAESFKVSDVEAKKLVKQFAKVQQRADTAQATRKARLR